MLPEHEAPEEENPPPQRISTPEANRMHKV
jgi:hypothetical protein